MCMRIVFWLLFLTRFHQNCVDSILWWILCYDDNESPKTLFWHHRCDNVSDQLLFIKSLCILIQNRIGTTCHHLHWSVFNGQRIQFSTWITMCLIMSPSYGSLNPLLLTSLILIPMLQWCIDEKKNNEHVEAISPNNLRGDVSFIQCHLSLPSNH